MYQYYWLLLQSLQRSRILSLQGFDGMGIVGLGISVGLAGYSSEREMLTG